MRDHFTMVELEQEVRTKVLAEVRAKVAALPDHEVGEAHHDVLVWRADVLALLDGTDR